MKKRIGNFAVGIALLPVTIVAAVVYQITGAEKIGSEFVDTFETGYKEFMDKHQRKET